MADTRSLGVVYLLWAERPTSDSLYAGDQGLLVGAYADIIAAREAAIAERRAGRKGSLSIVREGIRG